MSLKKAFRHTDGAQIQLETDNLTSMSETDVVFANLPADVQTIAAAHSALADWRMGTLRKGVTESYWFSRAGAPGDAIT